MFKYFIKRVLLLIPVILGVIFIVFMIMQMAPSDPVYALLGSNITPEQYAFKAKELGLDKPLIVQYLLYIKNIVTRFDLGTSYADGRAVTTIILERFPVTLRLGLLGICLPIFIGIPFGILAAVKHDSVLDRVVCFVSLIFASMPDFWYSLMLMLLFSLKLGWVPSSGIDSWKCWILPVIAVGMSPVAGLTRMTRSSMLDAINKDYVRTARSKGLTEWKVITHHVLKNGMIPVMTDLGMQLGNIMAGAVVVETIFNIPGMGTMISSAIGSVNYPLVQGSVAFLSVFICGINLLIDMAYALIDPRIRAQYSSGKKRKQKKAPVAAVAGAEGGDQ